MTVDISRRTLIAAGTLIVAAPLPALAATPSAELKGGLAGFQRFIGSWRGEGEGEPGKSTVERTYEPTLGGKFILVRHTSVYPPQEKNPKGETHEDVGYMSFDKARRRLVFRQFHIEGFVNHYVAETEAIEGGKLVLDSEAIENIPKGFRARETYKFSGDDAFEEIFELAEPGKEFSVYSHNRFRRV
jgi:hypothetical protein